MKCKNCGYEVDKSHDFCASCGTRVKTVAEQETGEAVSAVNFIQSIKSDIGNSQTISAVKAKVTGADKASVKKYGIIVVAVIILIGAVSVLTNIHSCESCGKTYVGKKYRIQGIFNDYKCCEDCYRDYYY